MRVAKRSHGLDLRKARSSPKDGAWPHVTSYHHTLRHFATLVLSILTVRYAGNQIPSLSRGNTIHFRPQTAMDSPAEKQDTLDPLALLPAEIVLRILDFASLSSVASLTRVTKAWNAFIDTTHQDAIFSSPSKVERPLSSKDFSFAKESLSFSKYADDISSWKDLCRRQVLLAKGWQSKIPVTRESTIQVGNDPIWRFRPDFKRRIFLSTSQMGGMNVTDMDSGELLWRLDANTVRPFAHLEYEDGTAVWDREGNAVEVWKADPDAAKGVFQRVAILEHDRLTRGFQLTKNTLCVVSSEKKGYVYDLSGEPTLKREIDIEEGAVGHLDQGPNVVAYSIGNKGYHFFEKETGEFLGIIHPKNCSNTFHINHPKSPLDCRLGVGNSGRAGDAFPPRCPGKDRTAPLKVERGEHPPRPGVNVLPLEEDEWGAGMLNGDMFAGVSRGGRAFICSNWRRALKSEVDFKEVTASIECDSDGSTFDLGGWLAVRHHKIMFETQDRAYIIGLNDDNTLKSHDESPQRPSYAYATSSAAQLAVPVSFMGIYDDCVMTTYTVSHSWAILQTKFKLIFVHHRLSATANASKSKSAASRNRARASYPQKSSAS